MNMDLTRHKSGEVFQVENDARWFKILEFPKTNNGETLVYIKFYAYAYEENSNVWRLDYDQATELAEKLSIYVEYSKITHVVEDIMMFSAYTRNDIKENHGVYIREGKKYIAEAKVVSMNDERQSYTRTASAGMDNVAPKVITYAPVDALNLKGVVEDFYEHPGKADKKVTKKKKQTDDKITNLQMEQLKILDPKFTKKKYESKTEKQAGEILNKLRPKKNTKKRPKK